MRFSIYTILFLSVLLLFLGICGCSANPISDYVPVPKGNRRLAIDVSMPEKRNYDLAFNLAKNVGIQEVGLFFNWNDIEQRKGQYNSKFLTIANNYYPQRQTKVVLTIAPIHTNQLVVPGDLKKKSFDDPLVITRFKNLLDYIFSQTPILDISSIVIGSEFEAYLGNDENKWRQYESFLKQVTAYSHLKRPRIKVAYEAQFHSLTSSSKVRLKHLNKSADIIGVSYYPLNIDFTVKDSDVVESDFAQIVKLYPKKKIYFFQFGYPSSKYLKSSPNQQRMFIENTFRAWDKFPRHIKMIDFTWLHDRDPSSLAGTAKFYGIKGRAFREFIGSLGLRTFSGSGHDKSAFKALVKQAKLRGW